ncbi:BPTI/Kunitz domain-containing protein-like [Daphnia pulex]|uniref:BPTI/Kunitz domain-containing protein-like n=1 Tax=Daphnia pulex TaxID=6669 RepID=UPI001EE107E9|nr:BPTI/Kunitz domain-containing protein-like [Daphnia pulex]XP_046635715.1 BPTI/Kunitz domain-containing protein-like [Daphnia pulicaria]
MLLVQTVKFVLLFVYVTSAWANPEFDADPTTVEDARNRPSICFLPPIEGSVQCKGFFIRWTYNAQTEKCEKFIYGGCFGTANLFRNQHACLAKCNRKGLNELISDGGSSICLQKKDEGSRSCSASIPSYFFEAASGLCKPFRFSGCDGNGNRFPTEQECEQACYYGPSVAAVCDPALTTV